MRSRVAVNFEGRVSISGVEAENCRAEWADLSCQQAPPQPLGALSNTTVTSACIHLRSCNACVSYNILLT